MKYEKEIFARYDGGSVRVYQAYNPGIAEEAVALQRFGARFNVNRMTWIKPSFLWMMYRSGWGTKKDQECILGLDIRREVFCGLLEKAVLTSPDSPVCRGVQWEKAFGAAEVYCQWDPDRSVSGSPIQRAAIQIGLKGAALEELLSTGICRIEDLTPSVRKWNEQRKNGKLDGKKLPVERLFPVSDRAVRQRLGMG